MQFDRADTNHDGKLSLDEANAFLVNRTFDALDTNHDGRLSAAEATGADSGAMPDFKKRDANHDGFVTREEALAYGRKHGMAKKLMEEADTDHDGKLSWEEVKAYYADREGPPR